MGRLSPNPALHLEAQWTDLECHPPPKLKWPKESGPAILISWRPWGLETSVGRIAGLQDAVALIPADSSDAVRDRKEDDGKIREVRPAGSDAGPSTSPDLDAQDKRGLLGNLAGPAPAGKGNEECTTPVTNGASTPARPHVILCRNVSPHPASAATLPQAIRVSAPVLIAFYGCGALAGP